MSYRTIDIQQAMANVDSKLSLRSYSSALKKQYGLFQGCDTHELRVLQLMKFALGKWDTRPGATNYYSEAGLTSIIRTINQL